MENPTQSETTETGQDALNIQIRVSHGMVRRCVPITHSGAALQETYERQLAYIRAHARKLGISEFVVEALQTLFCPRLVRGGHIAIHPQESELCDSLESCTQHPMQRKPANYKRVRGSGLPTFKGKSDG